MEINRFRPRRPRPKLPLVLDRELLSVGDVLHVVDEETRRRSAAWRLFRRRCRRPIAESRLVWLLLVPVRRSLLLLDLVLEGTLVVVGPDTLPDEELAFLSIKPDLDLTDTLLGSLLLAGRLLSQPAPRI